MIYVIYAFAGIFVALGGAMFYVFYRERHFGMFLMGLTYAISGLMALAVANWWPLIAGFVLVWMLRMLGLEMGPEEIAGPPSKGDGMDRASGAADAANDAGEKQK
jgi:hypothetical protein